MLPNEVLKNTTKLSLLSSSIKKLSIARSQVPKCLWPLHHLPLNPPPRLRRRRPRRLRAARLRRRPRRVPAFVKRSDPHNLPFIDAAFDLGFSDGLDGALFPGKFAEEMERTVRVGGAAAAVVERVEVEEIRRLFRRSRLVEVRIVRLDGAQTSLIVMSKNCSNGKLVPVWDLQSSIPPDPPAAIGF